MKISISDIIMFLVSITAVLTFVILTHISGVYDAMIPLSFINKILFMFWISLMCIYISFGSAFITSIITEKIEVHRSKKFNWYNQVGLRESAWFVTPRVARKFWRRKRISKTLWSGIFK